MLNLSNIKMVFRNARKNSALTFAKLFGISISFAVILFAAGYVYYETSFDKFVPDKDKIFRIYMKGNLNGDEADYAVTSAAMAETIVHDIPEITEATRLRPDRDADIHYHDEIIKGGPLLFADSNFFSFFHLPIKKTSSNLFGSKNDIAISESLAIKLFGNADAALDKVVKLMDEDCVITGVFKDFPKNFHLQYQVVQSIEKSQPEKQDWGSQSYYTYIKTNTANPDVDKLSFQLTKTVYTHSMPEIDGAKAKTWDDMKANDSLYLFYLVEPLTAIHFSNHKFDPAVTASKTYVYGAIILALLVLLISSINFTNLTIANLSTRLKEIGIRKTTGAFSGQIATQFLYESLIFWTIGFFLAIVLYEVGGKPLAHYLNLSVEISPILLIKIFLLTFLALLLFNMLTNILPIYYVSKRKVLNLLKDEKNSHHRFTVKNSFVFLQFALSALIILSSIIVQKQISYMVNKNRGYDGNNVLMFNLYGMSDTNRKSFINDLKAYAAIKDLTSSDVNFGKDDPGMTSAYFETQNEDNFVHTSAMQVDDEFLKTFGLKMNQGRFFDMNHPTDDKAVILNQTAANEYRKKGSLIGKELLMNNSRFRIIGIISDFNYRSLYHKIQPLIMLRAENNGNIFVKYRTNEISDVIAILQKQWKKYNISQPLQYEFHNAVLASQYGRDQQAKKLLLILSILSIAIAAVGLYAISLFTIISKTKEIGIRKVNGANISEVMTLLNKDFIKWVAIAFVVATPVAWYVMNLWLENFAYRTGLSWWVFALAGILSFAIALFTVSWQSYKAATRNPIDALRYE
ncbi:ABC transporter permease [Prolixibacter denitrificans]|uniref:ABC transporter permease n=1 Tax=Prolixibacter denitrificans TaxID=1541063 RepID=A0A2P8CDW4_9BACT|nr:ABC transporter permease [Prolixibacter denitrificans]PSK83178.1 putative ABC transport system permease protein [Prolixibacter denitrificans]GET21939.1 ABC transporter permease [Prolixibacter denitrificans]